MSSSLSKSEYLKRYLEPNKKKRKTKDVSTVKYIHGDLPETLDGLCTSNSSECTEQSGFPVFSETEKPTTIVRQATLDKSTKSNKKPKIKVDPEVESRYELWNLGIKTVHETYERLRQQEYESSKPLARYADDKDLTQHLKSQIHADDPMAAYFSKKAEKKQRKQKVENGDAPVAKETNRPLYQGIEPPPNRFGIKPGYRWDGVDRSNGFENRIIDEATRRKVERQIAQQWSVEDM